jgi:hypothetical protein
LEEVDATQRCKDQDSARLSEELGALQARLAQAEARLSAQAKQAHRDMQDMQDRHSKEVFYVDGVLKPKLVCQLIFWINAMYQG